MEQLKPKAWLNRIIAAGGITAWINSIVYSTTCYMAFKSCHKSGWWRFWLDLEGLRWNAIKKHNQKYNSLRNSEGQFSTAMLRIITNFDAVTNTIYPRIKILFLGGGVNFPFVLPPDYTPESFSHIRHHSICLQCNNWLLCLSSWKKRRIMQASIYCLSKKSWPILCSKLLYKFGQKRISNPWTANQNEISKARLCAYIKTDRKH